MSMTRIRLGFSAVTRHGVAVVMLGAILSGCGVGGDGNAAVPTDPPPSTTAEAGSIPITQGTLPTGSTAVAPVRLEVPAIGVVASVRPAGIDPATGELSVPPSVDTVGWYQYGPGLEAQLGSVVIAGHVDSAEQGRGAFFRLRELRPGDRLSVTGSDGAVHSFMVTAQEEWPKSRIPLERYFVRDGALRLTLITCGGRFDLNTRNYEDNVVVTAQPA